MPHFSRHMCGKWGRWSLFPCFLTRHLKSSSGVYVSKSVFLPLILAVTAATLSRGSSSTVPRHLESITISQTVSGQQIQFIATGTFSAAPMTLAPLPVDWGIGRFAPPPGGNLDYQLTSGLSRSNANAQYRTCRSWPGLLQIQTPQRVEQRHSKTWSSDRLRLNVLRAREIGEVGSVPERGSEISGWNHRLGSRLLLESGTCELARRRFC